MTGVAISAGIQETTSGFPLRASVAHLKKYGTEISTSFDNTRNRLAQSTRIFRSGLSAGHM